MTETNLSPETGNTIKKVDGSKAATFAADLAEGVKTYSSTAMDSISGGYDSAVAWVKKNPLQAAAIGAGVGFLVGALVRRYARKDS